MKFQERISPRYTLPATTARGEIHILRERILQSMLLLFGVLGLIQLILISLTIFREGNKTLLFVYTGLYLVVVGITLAREAHYTLRAGIAVTLIYLLAISELFESGQIGDVRMILIVFVAMTAVLFSYRVDLAAIAIGTATVVIAGNASAIPEVRAAMPVFAKIEQGAAWATSAVGFMLYASAVAGPIAMIIDGMERNLLRQLELTSALERERSTLGNRIQERTADISRRLVQLRTVADLTRSLSALTDPMDMLRQSVELIRERFDLYYVGVFLLDQYGQNAVLQAGTGEAGRRMLANGHRLAVGGNSMIGWAVSNRQARIALDVGADAVRFSNPNLPLTRSELALPIIAGDKVLGAMTVQSSKSNAFDENDIAVLQGLADGLGVALENDRIFNETRQSLEEIRAFNREYLLRSWAEVIESHGDLSYSYDNAGVANPLEHNQVVEVPLMLRNEVIGQIVLETDHPVLSEDQSSFVENITNQTVIAMENARLLEETERRAIQEQKLNELTTRFASASSIDEILRTVAQDLGQLPSVSSVSVRLAASGKSGPVAAPDQARGNGKEPTP